MTSTRRPLFSLPVWISLVLLALLAAPGATKKPSDPDELFNPILGLDYSHWLVGPVVEIATEDEVERYLRLVDDDAAREFIDTFWAKRAEGTPIFQKTPKQLFDERAVEADKRFTEGAYPGRQTDRGKATQRRGQVIGEPESIDFESQRKVGQPALEVWTYPDDAPAGLDGDEPKRRYRFIDLGDSVVFYTGQKIRRNLRDRPRRY